MLKTYNLVDGRLVECPAENAQIYAYANPDDREKASLLQQSIDEYNLNSSLDPDELGRIEFEPSHLAIIIKRPKRYNSQDNFLFKVSSLGLFLFADKLIMVNSEGDVFSEGKIFTKIHSIEDLFLRVMFSCVTHFEEHLRVIRKISDELELEINQALSNRDLLHMFKLEKSLVFYLDAINSNSKVAEKLRVNSGKINFSKEGNAFLEDLIIEGNQCFKQAETYSQVLSSMMDAWASIINNNLNIRIKTLTILSLCIMTPTFIVSLFSMNMPLPLPHTTTLLSFWIVVGMAATAVGVLVLVFNKKW